MINTPKLASKLALIVAFSAQIYAAEGEKKPSAPPSGRPAPQVATITTEAHDVSVTSEGLGFTQPSLVSEVRSRLTAFITERLFKEGDFVKEGDVLYRLDAETFRADVEIAEARIAADEARLRLAELDLKRIESLRSSGAVAQEDEDQARAETDQSRAQLRLDKATLEKSKLILGYAEIHAPISGLIGKTNYDVGSLVDDKDKSLLTEITRIDPIYITFAVSEKEYLNWRAERIDGSVVRPIEGEKRFEILVQDGSIISGGELNFEAPSFAVDTGTVNIRLSFPNPEARLKPGQFVKVRAAGWSRPNSITVPLRAVLQSPGGAAVFVVTNENKIEYRPITLGGWTQNNWIIESGLEAGESVVVDGFMKAPPGTTVTTVPFVDFSEKTSSNEKGT